MAPLRKSSKLRGLIPLFPLLSLMLGLGACATKTPLRPTLNIPASLREACERPNPEGVKTIGDLAAFSLRQDAAISVCEAKRRAVVEIVDGVQVRPKRKRWPF